jgi:CDP-diacylglycerol pyrophosphatase
MRRHTLQCLAARPFTAFLISAHAFIFLAGCKAHTDREALWRIVNSLCVPNMVRTQNPAPCSAVALPKNGESGYAVFKDEKGPTQYLLIPTARITGIESPALWAPDGPNYFGDAWAATSSVDQRLHRTLPRTDFALAINSVSGRSQDQLHIHIDCIRPEVKEALQDLGPQIGTAWTILPTKLRGHQYRALWLPGEALGERNPFVLLAGSLQLPAEEMGRHTLVLAGAEVSGRPGFILLDGASSLFADLLSPWIRLGSGSGEELEDHSCKVSAVAQ